MSDRWMERLSEYLDGELPAAELAMLETHLETCSDCRTVLADLRRVTARAGSIDLQSPRRDLWPGIASRIGATPLRAPPTRRMWSFSLPQLAAAAIALMTLSGGAVWLTRTSVPIPASAPIATGASPATTPAAAINTSRSAAQSYAAAVADLERVLAGGRGQLDSTTVRVIEQNLAVIDRAIAQAQRALNADPANLYLNTHLAETLRRKLDLLRQAATLVPVT